MKHCTTLAKNRETLIYVKEKIRNNRRTVKCVPGLTSIYYYNVRRVSHRREDSLDAIRPRGAKSRGSPRTGGTILRILVGARYRGSRARIFRRREDGSATLTYPPSPLFISSAVITANNCMVALGYLVPPVYLNGPGKRSSTHPLGCPACIISRVT